MAISNTLVKAQAQKSGVIEYQAGGETVQLSADTVRNYLVNGQGNVTDQEVMMFIKLCQHQHLNPFLREAYLIKYGSQPAQMVVGKDSFIKRARHRAEFDGFQSGLVIMSKATGEITEREGTIYLEDFETVVGGWAKVFIKGLSVPYYTSVNWREYCGRKSDGKLNSMWSSKPATMIRKVALSQALREAFPDDMAGMYEPEEINTIQEELPETPIQPPKGAVKPAEISAEAETIETPAGQPAEESVEKELFG